MHGRYVTDILKMCMKYLNAENIIFDKFTRFSSAHCGVGWGGGLCSQFLVIYNDRFGEQTIHFLLVK